jgi:hypothetical protein
VTAVTDALSSLRYPADADFDAAVARLLDVQSLMLQRIDRLEQLLAREPTPASAGPTLHLVEVPETKPSSPAVADFVREGDYWSISFGRDRFRLRDSKGVRYIAQLVASAGKEIHVLELVAADEGRLPGTQATCWKDGPLTSGLGGAGEVLDRRAYAAYRRRFDDLVEELDTARVLNDPERAATVREEMDFIVSELEAASGLHGRPRRTPCPAERARQSVAHAVKRARERIARESAALSAHLRESLQTGTFCSYMPYPTARRSGGCDPSERSPMMSELSDAAVIRRKRVGRVEEPAAYIPSSPAVAVRWLSHRGLGRPMVDGHGVPAGQTAAGD